MPEQLDILLQFAMSHWIHILPRIYRSSVVMFMARYQMIRGTTGNEFHMRIFLSFAYGSACCDTLISIVCCFQTTSRMMMQFSQIDSVFNSQCLKRMHRCGNLDTLLLKLIRLMRQLMSNASLITGTVPFSPHVLSICKSEPERK